MMGEFGLLGVPSSAAAHGPGQEKAPAALRRAGLPERLSAAGVPVADYGDLPVVRWRPDPHQRRPHNRQAVLDVLRQTSRRVGEILPDARVPLVLGGDCSVTLAVLSAFRGRGIEPALLYMDGGVDLFTPATNHRDPRLHGRGAPAGRTRDRRRAVWSRPGPAAAPRRPVAVVRLHRLPGCRA